MYYYNDYWKQFRMKMKIAHNKRNVENLITEARSWRSRVSHHLQLVFYIYLRNSMTSNLHVCSVQVLHLRIVSPLVRYVKCGCDWATVRIDSAALENIGVNSFIDIIDGIVKSQQNDLRRMVCRNSTWFCTNHKHRMVQFEKCQKLFPKYKLRNDQMVHCTLT